MKIGIGLPNQVRNLRPTVIPAWAAQAEAAGFSTLGTVGRIAYPGVMDTVAMAAAAGATSTIGLLSNVLLGPVWPPVLLAKEIAGIDGVSGGRLTLGLGIGGRQDDFVVDGLPGNGLGKRIDHDLEVYRSVWRGETVGGDLNAAVPTGTREVPLVFGGMSAKALARMAHWGQGYVGPSVPAAMVSEMFDAAKTAWQTAGRDGSPRLIGIAYFSLGDPEKGRANVADYYSVTGPFVEVALSATSTTPEAIRQVVKEYADLGTDELIFNSTVDDLDDISRLAEIVL